MTRGLLGHSNNASVRVHKLSRLVQGDRNCSAINDYSGVNLKSRSNLDKISNKNDYPKKEPLTKYREEEESNKSSHYVCAVTIKT
ncbi:hypothetical protein J6590_013150 [Homalodisca vitripennis]|nr:hypothetical protein J6590_013150 [Homalodisca vitripennis]